MIEPIFTGRLGNTMFQIAAAYAYSLKHGMDYRVPEWGNGLSAANDDTDKYIVGEAQFSNIMLKYLSWFPNVKRGITVAETFDGAYLQKFPHKKNSSGFTFYQEPGHEYNEIPYHENIVVNGYFQSEQYFKQYRKEIIALFNLPKYELKEFTAIHVRRGDYVKFHTAFPPVNIRYLSTAMKVMARNGFKNFLVFSDDLLWCKQNLNTETYPDYTFTYSDGKSEFEDLCMGASCSHNIISNSSFSWWQAWLNENPDKLVISPSEQNWFGHGVKLNRKDIIPQEWVKITF